MDGAWTHVPRERATINGTAEQQRLLWFVDLQVTTKRLVGIVGHVVELHLVDFGTLQTKLLCLHINGRHGQDRQLTTP